MKPTVFDTGREAGSPDQPGRDAEIPPCRGSLIVAGDLARMRIQIHHSYKLDGDTLWVTFQKNQNGPIVNPTTIKAVRVE